MHPRAETRHRTHSPSKDFAQIACAVAIGTTADHPMPANQQTVAAAGPGELCPACRAEWESWLGEIASASEPALEIVFAMAAGKVAA